MGGPPHPRVPLHPRVASRFSIFIGGRVATARWAGVRVAGRRCSPTLIPKQDKVILGLYRLQLPGIFFERLESEPFEILFSQRARKLYATEKSVQQYMCTQLHVLSSTSPILQPVEVGPPSVGLSSGFILLGWPRVISSTRASSWRLGSMLFLIWSWKRVGWGSGTGTPFVIVIL